MPPPPTPSPLGKPDKAKHWLKQTPLNKPNSWTKSRQSLNSFPPCCSQSSIQLCLRFLFLHTHATSYSFCKWESSLWFKKSIQKPQVWELSRLCLETSTRLNSASAELVFWINAKTIGDPKSSVMFAVRSSTFWKATKMLCWFRLEQSREDIIRDIKVYILTICMVGHFSLNIEGFVSGSVFHSTKLLPFSLYLSHSLSCLYRCTAQDEIWKAVPSSLPK